MIDPVHLTCYDRSVPELEEFILFGLLVAGKNAATTSKNMDVLLASCEGLAEPFNSLRPFSVLVLEEMLRSHGFGCYTIKARGVHELVHSAMNLKTCSVEDLTSIHGIGLKTANLFLMHSRKDYKGACLDTHILKHLKTLGHDVPKATPQSKKKYLQIEALFLNLADSMGMEPADLDLLLWRKYSGNTA